MPDYAGRRSASGGHNDHARTPAGVGPGKGSLTEMLPPIQRKASGGEPGSEQVHAHARRGIATAASPLPYGERIQALFGRHDISSVQAHMGGDAADSAHAMGAKAYATGDHVVLGDGSDLHTVAHEAAHVVQQRGGVQLKGGVGQAGDAYERHADEVADRVVQGKSAEHLLDAYAGGGRGGGGAQPVQHKLKLASDWTSSIPGRDLFFWKPHRKDIETKFEALRSLIHDLDSVALKRLPHLTLDQQTSQQRLIKVHKDLFEQLDRTDSGAGETYAAHPNLLEEIETEIAEVTKLTAELKKMQIPGPTPTPTPTLPEDEGSSSLPIDLPEPTMTSYESPPEKSSNAPKLLSFSELTDGQLGKYVSTEGNDHSEMIRPKSHEMPGDYFRRVYRNLARIYELPKDGERALLDRMLRLCRIEHKPETEKTATDPSKVPLLKPVDIGGVEFTSRGDLIKHVLATTGEETNVGQALNRMESNDSVSSNTDLKRTAGGVADGATIALRAAYHCSFGMGENGCAFFFLKSGDKLTVVGIGNHLQNNAKKYEIKWAAAGYPTGKFSFPGA